MKKCYMQKKSPIVILLYCLASVIGVYTLITVYNSYTYISQLVSQKGLVISEQLLNVITYYMNASLPYLFYTISIWGIGYIIDKINCFNKDKEHSDKVSQNDYIDINREEEDLDSFFNEIKSDLN